MCGRRRAQKDGPRVRLYFAHACKMGLEGIVSKGLGLSFGGLA